MAKDPAVLFYIDTWLTATAEMDSDVRGWYLNLILHHYDKGSLPNDVEKLAVLCGVKFSEFERFKQMLEQVLMQKLKLNKETNRLENPMALEILKSRENFKEKRGRSGNIGVVIKNAKTIKGFTEKHISSLKDYLYQLSDEDIENHKDKQVLEQMLKLYINGNKNISIVKYDFITIEGFREIFERWINYKIARKEKYKTEDSLQTAYNKLLKLSNSDPLIAIQIIDEAIGNNYAGFFALKNQQIATGAKQDNKGVESSIDYYNQLKQ